MRARVADYLRTLTAGDYGTAYVEYHRRIGAVHHRVGINIEWYLGAYAHLLRAIQPMVQATAVAPDERAALWDALLAVVFLTSA